MMQNKNKQTLAIIARLDHQNKFTSHLPAGKPSPDMPSFGMRNYFIQQSDLLPSEIDEFDRAGFKPIAIDAGNNQTKAVYVFTCVSGSPDTKVFIPHYKKDFANKRVLKQFNILEFANVEEMQRVANNSPLRQQARIDDIHFEDIRYIGIDVNHASLATLQVKDLDKLSPSEVGEIKNWQKKNRGVLLLKDDQGNLGFFTHDKLVDLKNGGQPTRISRDKLNTFGGSVKKLDDMNFTGTVSHYKNTDKKDIIHMAIASVDSAETDFYISMDMKRKKKSFIGNKRDDDQPLVNRQVNLTRVPDGIQCRFYDPKLGRERSYLLTQGKTQLSAQQYSELDKSIRNQKPISQATMNALLREMALSDHSPAMRSDDMIAIGKTAWLSQEYFDDPGLDKYLEKFPDDYHQMADGFLGKIVELNKQNLTSIDMKPDMMTPDTNGDLVLIDVGGVLPIRQKNGATTIPASQLVGITEFYCPTSLLSAKNDNADAVVDVMTLQAYLIAANILDMVIIANNGAGGYPHDKTIYGGDNPLPQEMQPGKIYFSLNRHTQSMSYYYVDAENQRHGFSTVLNATEFAQANQTGEIPDNVLKKAQEHCRAHDRARRKALIEKEDERGFDNLKIDDKQKNLIKKAMQDFNKPNEPALSAEDMQVWFKGGKRALVAHWIERYAENYLERNGHDGEEQALLRKKIESAFPQIEQQNTVKQRYSGKKAVEHQAGDRILSFFAASNEEAAARLKTKCIGVLNNTMIEGEQRTIRAGKLLYRMGNAKQDLLFFFNKNDDLRESDFKQFHIKEFISDKISQLITHIFKGRAPVTNEDGIENESLSDTAIANLANDNDGRGHQGRKRSDAIGNEEDAQSHNASPPTSPTMK